MPRIRFCKIGPSVLLALLLSLVNTLVILVYLGPLNFKSDAPSNLPKEYIAFTPLPQAPEKMVKTTMKKTPEIQQISVINQNDINKIDLPQSAPNNTWKKVEVLEDFDYKLDKPSEQEENLDHAYQKLKFNRNLMSMVGRSPLKPVDIVIGIPTVQRTTTDYISSTLRHLVKYLNENETKQCHIVVYCANFEQAPNDKTANFIKQEFAKEVAAGLIEVIKPDMSFYPKFKDLPLLWKDKQDRVIWRSKQCIDYALLFAYSRKLGHYYLQLEDDVSVSATYFREIKNFIRVRGQSKWSNLQFGTSGFIGMLFKSSDLGRLALFVKMYYWIFPVDILFRHYNDIHLYGNTAKDVYRPPLFRHLGRESSLKGQTRKLEGGLVRAKQKPNTRRYTDATNPSAFISTNIPLFESHSIDGPYRTTNLGYFWGKGVNLNDFVLIEFMKELTLLRVVFETGSEFAMHDFMAEGQLETTGVSKAGNCDEAGYKLLPSTTSGGKIESTAVDIPNVKCVKLSVTMLNLDEKKQSRWLLIREIAVWSK